MATTYRVVIQGVAPGNDLGEVAAALSQAFKLPVYQLAPVLNLPRFVIRRALTLADAAKYEQVLQQAGVVCIAEPDLDEPTPSADKQPTPAHQPSAIDTASPAAELNASKRKWDREVRGVGAIAVALFVSVVLLSGNNSSAAGQINVLEAALVIGKSNRAQMQHFLDEGGLDYEHYWRGYYVTGVGATYKTASQNAALQDHVAVSDPAPVSGFALQVYKKFPGSKLASINNLKASLRPECGDPSSWKQLMDAGWSTKSGTHSCDIINLAAMGKGIGILIGVKPL